MTPVQEEIVRLSRALREPQAPVGEVARVCEARTRFLCRNLSPEVERYAFEITHCCFERSDLESRFLLLSALQPVLPVAPTRREGSISVMMRRPQYEGTERVCPTRRRVDERLLLAARS